MINTLALFFAPDGYVLPEGKILGRQAAGHSFLNALLQDDEISTLQCYTPSQKNAETFEKLVASLSPKTPIDWVNAGDIESLKSTGVLFFPDPTISWPAAIRMRGNLNAYSICGITHTMASHAAMNAVRSLSTSAIMPWDALICTSQSVKNTVLAMHEAHKEFLNWRFKNSIQPEICQFPVIPLGVHAQDFKIKNRKSGRTKLNIADDEIAVLYLGRFCQYTKANLLPMYMGLDEVAKQTGKKIVLIEYGQAPDKEIDAEIDQARNHFGNHYRWLKVDGKKHDLKNICLQSADIFVSLSDNIQESFGITPVEAMASGLPVIISEWDGYKELIEHGVEGFKIPTIMPTETEPYAAKYEAGGAYERYCASIAQTTAIDLPSYMKALVALIDNATLRKQMGKKGIERVQSFYDWPVVLKQYKELWSELRRIRIASETIKIPSLNRQPSHIFRSYPSGFLTNETALTVAVKNPLKKYQELKTLGIVDIGSQPMPTNERVKKILFNIKSDTLDVSGFDTQREVTILLKLGILTISFS